jgi:CheY-like chemotaxis protein
VHEAHNGQEALDILEHLLPDAVFMDIQMPVLDGLEATRAIRAGRAGQDRAGVPVFALTAYAMDGDRDHFLTQGMDGYLAKPVDARELSRVVQAILDRAARG